MRIYEYTPGFIHAKNFVVDDRFATVGTVNLDYRSLFLHFEDGVWLCEAPAFGTSERTLRTPPVRVPAHLPRQWRHPEPPAPALPQHPAHLRPPDVTGKEPRETSVLRSPGVLRAQTCSPPK